MKSIILRMVLPEVLALLQLFIKNPTALAGEVEILTAVRDSINTILIGINPNSAAGQVPVSLGIPAAPPEF